MAYEFRKDILPKGHRNRPGYPMDPKGLLYHTTNNWSDGAGDEMHAEYMEDTTRVVSWHDTVDKDSCTQHLPHNENGWHAGDGGDGYYNRNWLGMEIACEAVAPGEKLDAATYNNAVRRAADICEEYDFGWEDLQPHHVVYGKNCPHTTLFSRDQFKRDVFALIKKRNSKPSSRPTQPTQPNTDHVYVIQPGDSLSVIAQRFNTNTSTLAKLNNIKNPSLIMAGGKLKIPAYIHVVKKGDTLSGIAERYDTNTTHLVRLNRLADPDKIYVGQRLKLVGTPQVPKPKKKKVPAKPKPKPINDIPVKGYIQIGGTRTGKAYVCDKPSQKSENLATVRNGTKLPIAGSVPGWWEVIYEGKRAYVNEKFGRKM
jgi:N-acetylmuramoyl-L-alanine amidase CwlA